MYYLASLLKDPEWIEMPNNTYISTDKIKKLFKSAYNKHKDSKCTHECRMPQSMKCREELVGVDYDQKKRKKILRGRSLRRIFVAGQEL